ncbi:hypothetical protein E2C01_030165 [Portunus trituberculatus]|uniref:Uncharacterized protein n=1 Tax=Portunus trituberculatus TaxID=210409 RepID=A0A5B7ETY6_PORTR|nr:hypothetical protein [Portunus trituberculatus]
MVSEQDNGREGEARDFHSYIKMNYKYIHTSTPGKQKPKHQQQPTSTSPSVPPRVKHHHHSSLHYMTTPMNAAAPPTTSHTAQPNPYTPSWL